ncbi:MAG: glycosyltransferase [Candidatus Pacearchaeota archaeon]|jgi:cellulose synthase/poly-beta-1,6-N-acetylglucosamine synthase-like glycosyltransferase
MIKPKKKITLVIPAKQGAKLSVLETINKSDFEIIIETGNNTSRNRNNGIKKAKTELVAFTNAHTVLNFDWLIQVEKFFKKHPEIDIVGGPQLNYSNEKFFARSSGYALSSLFGASVMSKRYSQGKLSLNADETVVTSANLICRKKVFKRVKFDENIYPGEDPKFISDAKAAGFKIAYTPEIIVYNLRRNSFSELFKQIFNYGRVRPKKENFLETIKRPYFICPTLFLIYLLILPTLSLISKYFLIPGLIYVILSLVFSVYESILNKEFKSVFILPFIFLTIHLSYGLGFLIGLMEKYKTK